MAYSRLARYLADQASLESPQEYEAHMLDLVNAVELARLGQQSARVERDRCESKLERAVMLLQLRIQMQWPCLDVTTQAPDETGTAPQTHEADTAFEVGGEA